MSKTRTFVAVPSDAALRRRADGVIARLRPHAPGARWVDEENLHLTLMFLGDLSDGEVAEVCSQTDWVARANAPFSVRVSGVGAFPTVDRPKALWLGVGGGVEALKRLQQDLEDAVSHLAPRGENRAFVPHWTIARMGRRGGGVSPHLAEAMRRLADYDAGELLVDEIHVLGSELRPEGPEYYALATCPLGLGG